MPLSAICPCFYRSSGEMQVLVENNQQPQMMSKCRRAGLAIGGILVGLSGLALATSTGSFVNYLTKNFDETEHPETNTTIPTADFFNGTNNTSNPSSQWNATPWIILEGGLQPLTGLALTYTGCYMLYRSWKGTVSSPQPTRSDAGNRV